MAGSVKGTLGPTSFVGEWNGAIDRARFVDDLGRVINIRPSAWQATLAYQFDWNPWVEAIGLQGDYVVLGYSESRGLGGATRVFEGQESRVGFVPRKRLLVGFGEWVLDNLRWAIEYSYNEDYSRQEGGTGHSAQGVITQFTAVW
jgi:hypothetical protein